MLRGFTVYVAAMAAARAGSQVLPLLSAHDAVSTSRTQLVPAGAASPFRWQRGYGAFSVSPNDVPVVERYVREQRHHHALRAIEPSLEPDEQSLP
jgi:hypothetical protein